MKKEKAGEKKIYIYIWEENFERDREKKKDVRKKFRKIAL